MWGFHWVVEKAAESSCLLWKLGALCPFLPAFLMNSYILHFHGSKRALDCGVEVANGLKGKVVLEKSQLLPWKPWLTKTFLFFILLYCMNICRMNVVLK